MKRNIVALAFGTLAVATATAFAPSALAGGNVAWSVSVGVPGLAVTAGVPAFGPYYGAPYRPYWAPYFRPVVVAPTPVVVAPPAVVVRPWFAPPPVARVYLPRPVVHARPLPAPYYRY